MWTEANQYFKRTMVPNSIFGKPLLHLKSVCWFNPWVVVENIPSSWSEIAIDVHHVNLPNCRLPAVNLEVKMAPMSSLKDEKPKWVMVQTSPYNGSKQRQSNDYLTELLTKVTIPVDVRTLGSRYAIQVQFAGCNGTWKSSWQFDGITIR